MSSLQERLDVLEDEHNKLLEHTAKMFKEVLETLKAHQELLKHHVQMKEVK